MDFGEVSFRERIKLDFGLDLPIGSGSRSSRADPLVILAPDRHTVAVTEMLVLRCLGIVLERLWRVRSRNSLDGQWRNIEQVKIETVHLTPTEIITQQVSHYFDVAASAASEGSVQDRERQMYMPVGFVDVASGIVFPYEIGWMHFAEAIANEPAHPGLGQTIQYTALNSKGSVYVNDKNIGDFPDVFDPEFLTPEFNAAASDVFEFNSNVRSIGDRRLAVNSSGTSYLRQDFKIGADHSVLALSIAARKYLKVRATWASEPLFDDVGNEFIDRVFDLVSTSSRLQ